MKLFLEMMYLQFKIRNLKKKEEIKRKLSLFQPKKTQKANLMIKIFLFI